jgi:acyl carrier protein
MQLNQDQLTVRQVLANLNPGGLGLDQIYSEMSIGQDLGIDSLNFIRLILEVESRVGRKIFEVQTIAGIKTVGDLYDVLNGR